MSGRRPAIAPRIKQKFGADLVTEAIGSVMMVDRLTAQGASPRVTIVQWDVPIGIAACEKGQCAEIDVEKAPNLKKLPDWALSKGPSGKPVVLTAGAIGVGILYNEEELRKNKLSVPKSWSDLKKREYAGRLGITAPQSSMGTAALVMLARINGGGEKNIEPGFQATKEIVPKNTIFTWSSEMSNLFQLGDLWLAVNSANIAPALRAKGIPIRFALPLEGSPTRGSVRCSDSCACRASRASSRPSFPAACSSASRWRGRWSRARTSSSSTSRCRTSTRRCARRCRSSCGVSIRS
jgi:putative spermidine/putrescine transport system substrate-binding protein